VRIMHRRHLLSMYVQRTGSCSRRRALLMHGHADATRIAEVVGNGDRRHSGPNPAYLNLPV